MKLITTIFISLIALVLISCSNKEIKKTDFVSTQMDYANSQLSLLLNDALENNKIPRTIEDGEMHWTNANFDWTEGFWPGTCWMLYDYTKDNKWKEGAIKSQSLFENHKTYTTNHDLGFVFNTSFGHAFRSTKNNEYKKVMIEAATSLSTRFNENVGCIKSWDVDKGWQSTRGWMYPVIIDNMMNLELLFEVSILTGDDKFKEIAITHANTTMKNHFRPDGSSFHVIDYDPETGAVRNKHTAQGFAHESAWARGQAWGLYGYTLCYRYTKDPVYLEMANTIANFILTDPNLPEDKIPYWDYDADKIPNEPRDVSAAAVIVSALIELNDYTDNKYTAEVDHIMKSLASEKYTAKLGTNKNFLLMHSVGSIPHGNEIDVPLNYADYYYVEALLRLKERAK